MQGFPVVCWGFGRLRANWQDYKIQTENTYEDDQKKYRAENDGFAPPGMACLGGAFRRKLILVPVCWHISFILFRNQTLFTTSGTEHWKNASQLAYEFSPESSSVVVVIFAP